jgi:hypothetical protein
VLLQTNCVCLRGLSPFNDFPTEGVGEIVKALIANPMGAVQCRVSFMKHFGTILNHEFRPAKSAMIVIVSGDRMIRSMNDRSSLKILLLISETPVFVFGHRCNEASPGWDAS